MCLGNASRLRALSLAGHGGPRRGWRAALVVPGGGPGAPAGPRAGLDSLSLRHVALRDARGRVRHERVRLVGIIDAGFGIHKYYKDKRIMPLFSYSYYNSCSTPYSFSYRHPQSLDEAAAVCGGRPRRAKALRLSARALRPERARPTIGPGRVAGGPGGRLQPPTQAVARDRFRHQHVCWRDLRALRRDCFIVTF